MANRLKRISNRFDCSVYVAILAFLWIAGMLLGTVICQDQISLFSLMRISAFGDVSIVGLILVYFIPLLISFAVVLVQKPALIYICAFFLALSCGINLHALYAAFYSASWLMFILLLFSRNISVVLFLWFALGLLACDAKLPRREAAVACNVSIVAGAFDLFILSPFLAQMTG